MAADSPPLSPLSSPPSWFRDEDIECPQSPAALSLSSSLSPPPSWIRDDDSQCPDFVWNAAESRLELLRSSPLSSTANYDDEGQFSSVATILGTPLPPPASPLPPVPVEEENSKFQSPKRPFEWLDSLEESQSPAKRACLEEEQIARISRRSEEEQVPDVSEITCQGDDSLSTELTETARPKEEHVYNISGHSEKEQLPDVSKITCQGEDSFPAGPAETAQPEEEDVSSISGCPERERMPDVSEIAGQGDHSLSSEHTERARLHEQVVFQEQPTILKEEPTFSQEVLRAFQEETITSHEQPTIYQEEPPVFRDEPTILEDEPTLFEDEPIVFKAEPAILKEQPIVFEEEPTAFEEEPVSGVSDTTSQGGNSVFTEPNEPGTPLSPSGELTVEVRPENVQKPENDFKGKTKPEVWATFRGGLCEALPYFRAYKGSLHTQDRTALGFLIDKEASARDVFSSQVIISSVGGGRVRDAETNKRVRCEDAPDTAANINALRLAHERRALVAVVAGEDHPLYPSKPPCPYAVLDWFHITDVWGELHETRPGQRPVRLWRIRLEKADLSKPSWWNHSIDQGAIPALTPEYQTTSTCCNQCHTESKEIFKAGWTCLNYHCGSFFQFESLGPDVDVNKLEYTDAFLRERTPFVGPLPPLVPQLPKTEGLHGTEKLLRRGFVCPECGHCSRRLFWNWFACESCPYKLEAAMLPYPEEELAREEAIFDERMAKRRKQKPIKIVVVRKPEAERFSAGSELTDKDGDLDMDDISVVDETGENETSNSSDPIEFQIRRDSTEEIVQDTQDSRSISPRVDRNWAEPFSTVFNRDAIPITQTLHCGQYRVRQYFLPDPEGNIIGSFALFISNPVINASRNGPNELFRQLELLDIGLKRNPAAVPGHKMEGLTRHFQQNFGARYKFGVTVQSKGFNEAPDVILRALHRMVWAGKNAVQATTSRLEEYDLGPDGPPPTSNEFNELLALGYMEDDRINYHDDGESELGPTVAALSLGSPSTMKFRPKLRSGFNDSLPKKGSGKAFLDVLEVPMKHGDMMVMHGRAIHRYYEHAVEPMGSRRFSLTCRYIDPDKMSSQADRDDAAVKGAIPEHAKNFVYNGEV